MTLHDLIALKNLAINHSALVKPFAANALVSKTNLAASECGIRKIFR